MLSVHRALTTVTAAASVAAVAAVAERPGRLVRAAPRAARRSLAHWAAPRAPLGACAPTAAATRAGRLTRLVPRAEFHASRAVAAGDVIDYILSDIGEGIAEVEIMQWFVKPGDHIKQFDRVCEVQSDKATVEITSRYDGEVREICYQVGDMAAVGTALMKIESADAAAPTPKAAPAAAPSAAAEAPVAAAGSGGSGGSGAAAGGKVLTTPAVRRLAREHGVDLTTVQGTGPHGRILKEDMLRHVGLLGGGPTVAQPPPQPPQQPQQQQPPPPLMAPPRVELTGEDRVQKVGGIQRVMVKTMERANNVPALLYCEDVRCDELKEARAHLKEGAEKEGIRLSFMPFIMKAASLAFHNYPQVNAHVNEDCTEVTLKAAHNIGVAMDTPRGLLVPCVKNVQHKSLLEIAAELNRLQALGMEGRLGKEELSGGTFTISNIGTIGGTYARPLLVVPQVAIVAIGKMQTVPRFDADMNVVPVTEMCSSFSADHRVIDGATIASFAKEWQGYLENPTSMLLRTR